MKKNDSSKQLTDAKTYLQQKDYKKVVETLNRGIAESPLDASLHFKLGRAYEAQNMFKEAVNAYSVSLFLSKKFPNIFSFLRKKLKLRRLENKLAKQKEEKDYDGPIWFQALNALKLLVLSFLLFPIWNDSLRGYAKLEPGYFGGDRTLFFIIYGFMNLVIFFEAFVNLFSGYRWRKYNRRVNFYKIKIILILLSINFIFYAASLCTLPRDIEEVNFWKMLYLLETPVFLTEAVIQLIIAKLVKNGRLKSYLPFNDNPKQEESFLRFFVIKPFELLKKDIKKGWNRFKKKVKK